MTTSRKLWLGFGTVTALLVLSGVTIVVRATVLETPDVVGLTLLMLAIGVVAALATGVAVGKSVLQTERAVAEQSELLRTTLASIGDGVISADRDGKVTYLNAVSESLTGWTNADAQGVLLTRVFHIVNESTRAAVENPAMRALKEGVIVGLANHTILISKDGTERPIEDSAAPIWSKESDIVGCVLVFRDVTERQQAETLLQASEKQRRLALDAAELGAWNIDLDSNVFTADERFSTMFRGSSDPLDFDQAFAAIHPEDQPRVRDAVTAATRPDDPAPYAEEYRVVHPDGSIRWVFAKGRANYAKTPTGRRLTTFDGTATDITDRKRLERELAQRGFAARQLATIVDSSDDAIISKSLDGIIQSWNAAAERLFGFSAEQAVGQQVSMLIPVDRVDEEEHIITQLRAGQKIDNFDTVRLRSDGKPVEVSLTISPIKDEAGRVIGASKIARDNTERKQLADELRQVAADLSEADRRKSEFLAMLVHELRNPLAPIRNAIQILQLSGDSGKAARSAVEMMDRQMVQMVRLVDDLLDVSRVSRGKIDLKRGRVELASVVSQAVEAVRSLYEGRGHDMTVTLPTEHIYLNADPARLAQVIGNLLNNACKFTDDRGHITLTVERDAEDAVIRVRDSGIGIASNQLPQIFDMFVQVDTSLERSVNGLGIGLTLVKSLVEMHGGKVEAHSAGTGQGSEFVVRLPIFTEPLAAVATSKASEPTPALARRMLVVDDNRDSAESLSMLLDMTGNQTQTAFDGQEAVAAAERFRPDVVLMDIGLPKLNGYEAARRIRQEAWGAKMILVALTGWGQEEDRQKSRNSGFDGHLVKPVDYATLMNLLAELTTAKARG